ncbi:MAG: hypothetical protein IPJ40_18305 [Saprospirales bacterium]|nr:hypothetical protein [Saprospirales bacterium]
MVRVGETKTYHYAGKRKIEPPRVDPRTIAYYEDADTASSLAKGLQFLREVVNARLRQHFGIDKDFQQPAIVSG